MAAKIADGAVLTAHYGASSVDAAALGDDSVDTASVVDDAISPISSQNPTYSTPPCYEIWGSPEASKNTETLENPVY